MKLALSALVFSISLTMPLHAADRPVDARDSARAEVEQLVERFKHAILVKDGGAIRGMFLPRGSWFRITDVMSRAAARAENSETRQVDPVNYEGFVNALVTSPAMLEETFDNVRIETDGAVGMVWFDYRFLADGKLSHRGVETWQVVRQRDGWKISGVLSHAVFGNSG